MRIAILNCYLQAGRTDIAESESTIRFSEVARTMGIEVKAFARSEEILPFEPDFVLAISFQDAKMTPFPTYGILNMPVNWVRHVPRFIRNILSYDGYWCMAQSGFDYLGALYEAAGKPNLATFCALSYRRTEFMPLDFRRSWAAYIGTNWDGQRHGNFFMEVAPSGAVKCYGKLDRWRYLPPDIFGGEVPFDGVSALKVYQSAGIGLCLGHQDFESAGVPSNRIFEVPAAGAVMIARRNPLIVGTYGDAVLYVDSDVAVNTLAHQVETHVNWVRTHPALALEMAEQCHRIFNERMSLEVLIENALHLHRTAVNQLSFPSSSKVPASEGGPAPNSINAACDSVLLDATVVVYVQDETLATLERCLLSIAHQTVAPRRVVIVDSTTGPRRSERMQLRYHGSAGISQFTAAAQSLDEAIGFVEPYLETDWVCVITANELLYPNHLAMLGQAMQRYSSSHKGAKPLVIYSGMVQISNTDELDELLRDEHNTPRSEHFRLAQFAWELDGRSFSMGEVAPVSAALNVTALRQRQTRSWINRIFGGRRAEIFRILVQGKSTFTSAVTLATLGYAHSTKSGVDRGIEGD